MRLSHPLRLGLLLALILFAAPRAQAQITWNVTYQDAGTGAGFDDPTVISGETKSLGQLRQDSVQAALNYLGTVLDGRGTTNLQFNTSLNSGSGGFLAHFGSRVIFLTDSNNQFSPSSASFQNGSVYQAARTNQRPLGGADGSGQFDFGYSYNYAGQANGPSGGSYDMTSIAIHEITHSLGFLSQTNSSGQGAAGQPVGSPDIYSVYDSHLQQGTGAGATPLFNTNINSTGYASFTGSASAFTSGNLYFNGKYSSEVLNGPVPLYAPSTYSPGSSVSHDATNPIGVMNQDITPNTIRRYQPYEIAMLLDIGWNTYNWNSSSGNWKDGLTDVSSSRWTSNMGIMYAGGQVYNTHSSPNPAPVLPVYGQLTSNIILNFGGSGTASYTSTNGIGQVRLVRLNLSSTSSAANTITGGTLLFGQDSDGTPSVITPKIVQDGTGAFNIGSTVLIPNGLTVDGAGSGTVTLTGVIDGVGGLTKAGTFPLVLTTNNTYTGGTIISGSGGTLQLGNGGTTGSVTGNIANNSVLAFNRSNTYTHSGVISGTGAVNQTGTGITVLTGNNTYSGATTVAAGELRVNGQTGTNSGTGTGAVTVNSGATVGGTGQIGNGTSGSLAVQSGGSVRPGDGNTIGTLTVNSAANTVLAGNSKLLINVGTSTTASGQLQLLGAGRLDLTSLSPSNRLSLILTAVQTLTAGQYTWNVIHLGGTGQILYPGAPVGSFSPDLFSITASNFTADASQFSITGTVNDINVVFTPVPEPAWVLLAAAPVVGLLALRRRRTAAPATPAA
jgi:autotransporter-associated beta strand protein